MNRNGSKDSLLHEARFRRLTVSEIETLEAIYRAEQRNRRSATVTEETSERYTYASNLSLHDD